MSDHMTKMYDSALALAGDGEPATRDLVTITNGSPIAQFVQSYQFDASDEGIVYTPTHAEQCMIEDAICSFISDSGLLSAALASSEAPSGATEPVVKVFPDVETVLKEMLAVATSDDDDEWLAEQRATVDLWQAAIRSALATGPIPCAGKAEALVATDQNAVANEASVAASAVSAPGMVMVPREPTVKMSAAGMRCIKDIQPDHFHKYAAGIANSVYEKMLAASSCQSDGGAG